MSKIDEIKKVNEKSLEKRKELAEYAESKIKAATKEVHKEVDDKLIILVEEYEAEMSKALKGVSKEEIAELINSHYFDIKDLIPVLAIWADVNDLSMPEIMAIRF